MIAPDFGLARELERDVSAYTVGGVRVPSVTECLAAVGMTDFSHVDPATLAQAAQRGRMAHAITARIDQGRPVGDIPGYVQPRVAAYEKFKADTGFVPELIEHVVVSASHRYAGTLDRVGLLRRERSLIDLKCSAAVYRSVGRQTAGYAIALGEPRMPRYALRLLPDGSYRLDRLADRADPHTFLACVRVTHALIADGLITLD